MSAQAPRRGRLAAVVGLVAAALIGYGVATVQPIVLRPPLVLGQDAISDAASASARVSLEGDALVVRPAEGDGRLLFVFYPGGLVRPQAYEWLGRALAARGVQTVIPVFAADLAVTDVNRADALLARYAAGRPVVVGGHSLGGAMVCDWAARHADAVVGLVLMGSYPADNVRVPGRPALSLFATHDALATPDKVRSGLARLPEGSRAVEIPGAVHAFFGRYGPQAGDGVPTTSRADAEAAIVTAIASYLQQIR